MQYFPNVYPGVSISQLCQAISFEQRSVTVYGKTYPQPRLTKWFGPVPYMYSGLSWPTCPMPQMLDDIRSMVEQRLGTQFNCVLANLYRSGLDHVHWHSDDESIFGVDPEVASMSFGVCRTFEMRWKADYKAKLKFALEHGSLLFMPRGTQREWQHRLPKVNGLVGERINLTFRFVP